MPDDVLRNHDRVGRSLQILKVGLREFLARAGDGEPSHDVSELLKSIAFRWKDLRETPIQKARTLAHELIATRNEWAHQVAFSEADTLRALDSTERLLKAIGSQQADLIPNLREPANRNRSEIEVPRQKRDVRVSARELPPTTRGENSCDKNLLSRIPFASDPTSSGYPCLMERLEALTVQAFGVTENKSGQIRRTFAPLELPWVRETRIEPFLDFSIPYLRIQLHIGDTKDQGKAFFELNPAGVEWPSKFRGFKIKVVPYLKIANAYATALLWIRPSQAESNRTHSKSFFDRFAGRFRRHEWDRFDNDLSKFVDDWKRKAVERDGDNPVIWNDKIVDTNMSQFLLSVGTNVSILIPYVEAERLDNQIEASDLATEYRKVVDELIHLVERSVH